MYKIMGTYKNKKEILDTTEDESTANYLVREYQLAFGSNWKVECVEPKTRRSK